MASLQTLDPAAGVPTEVEAGAELNRSLQDPAITIVRRFYTHQLLAQLYTDKKTQDPLNIYLIHL